MDRADIVAALEALGEELHRRGVTGEMYLVGGVAIALAYDERRSTRDLDACRLFDQPACRLETVHLPRCTYEVSLTQSK